MEEGEASEPKRQRAPDWTPAECWALLRAYVRTWRDWKRAFGDLPSSAEEWGKIAAHFKVLQPESSREAKGIKQKLLRELEPPSAGARRGLHATRQLLAAAEADIGLSVPLPRAALRGWTPEEDVVLLTARLDTLNAPGSNADQIDETLLSQLDSMCERTGRSLDCVVRRLVALLDFGQRDPTTSTRAGLINKMLDTYTRSL